MPWNSTSVSDFLEKNWGWFGKSCISTSAAANFLLGHGEVSAWNAFLVRLDASFFVESNLNNANLHCKYACIATSYTFKLLDTFCNVQWLKSNQSYSKTCLKINFF